MSTLKDFVSTGNQTQIERATNNSFESTEALEVMNYKADTIVNSFLLNVVAVKGMANRLSQLKKAMKKQRKTIRAQAAKIKRLEPKLKRNRRRSTSNFIVTEN